MIPRRSLSFKWPHVLAAAHRRPVLRGKDIRQLMTSVASSEERGAADAVAYCKNFVRQHDYESFLAAQFWPRQLQGQYFALKAFYVELAMVQDTVSNTTLGQMRMQFWRDAVKQISDGRPPRHPIALALFDASQRSSVSPYHLRRIIDARDNELTVPTHLTMDSLTSHAESTSSTLLYQLLSFLSLSDSKFSHAASHLGAAQMLSTLIRGLPFHTSQGRMVIPAEITAKHGVNQEDVFRNGREAKGIDDATYEFATVANDHLITARDMFKESEGLVPRNAMPPFLAGIPVASFLQRLEGVNFDAFHPTLQLKDWRLPWRVWRGYYKQQF